MNLEQLIAFDRIVREGSFSRAAWALEIAQPTISARIKALEQNLGGPLFERNNRVVLLTERGNRFLPYARQALEAMQKGADAAVRIDEAERGLLEIGVLRSLTGALISPVLQRFLQKYPETECVVKESNHWQLVDWLYDNQIELGLIAWPSLNPSLAEMTPLYHFRESMVLLAHKDHPLAQLEQVTVSDVKRLSRPFLLLKWWQVTPEVVLRLAEEADYAMEVPTDTGRYLIANGTGAGFFNASQVSPELIPSDVVRIKIADMSPLYRHSALVRLTRRSTLSPTAVRFAEHLAHQAKLLGCF